MVETTQSNTIDIDATYAWWLKYIVMWPYSVYKRQPFSYMQLQCLLLKLCFSCLYCHAIGRRCERCSSTRTKATCATRTRWTSCGRSHATALTPGDRTPWRSSTRSTRWPSWATTGEGPEEKRVESWMESRKNGRETRNIISEKTLEIGSEFKRRKDGKTGGTGKENRGRQREILVWLFHE